jgi:rod shape-determining protein MreC
MKKIIDFFIKYANTFLFLALEVLAIFMLIGYNNYQSSKFISETTEISGRWYKMTNGMSQYFHLRENNLELSRENAELKAIINKNWKDAEVRFRPYGNPSLVQEFDFIPAHVLNSSVNDIANRILIDQGELNGVEIDMGVISAEGVVGKVMGISKHYAVVMPIINKSFSSSGKLANTNYFGTIEWDGKDYRQAILNDIPSHVNIAKGDRILSRFGSGTYPEGELIGTISSWEVLPGDEFYTIYFDLAVDYRKVNEVKIVKHILQTELIELGE